MSLGQDKKILWARIWQLDAKGRDGKLGQWVPEGCFQRPCESREPKWSPVETCEHPQTPHGYRKGKKF